MSERIRNTEELACRRPSEEYPQMPTKIAQQIEVWKRDLIDLTRRNALLNTSSRAVGFTIEEPGATQFLSQLFKEKSPSIQLPLAEDGGVNSDVSGPDLQLDLANVEKSDSEIYRRSQPSKSKKYPDRFIQCRR